MNEEKKENTQIEIKAGFTPLGGLIPQSFDQMLRLAQIMHSSGFMPHGINSVAAVFVAMQMGLEVGLSPMQAVQNIAVINGRPCVWGDAALAIVKNSPYWMEESFEEEFKGEFPKDDFRAVCTMQRKGGKKKTVEFSIADAKKAGLWNKGGIWQNYPKRMLQMRARAWPLRDLFPEPLKGLRISEEIIDAESAEPAKEKTQTENIIPDVEVENENNFNAAINEELEFEFDKKIAKENIEQRMLDTYLENCAANNNVSISQVKCEALADYESFLNGLKKFIGPDSQISGVKFYDNPMLKKPEKDLFRNWTGFSQEYFDKITESDQLQGFLSTNDLAKIKDFPQPFIKQIEEKYKKITGKELFEKEIVKTTLTKNQSDLEKASEFVDVLEVSSNLRLHQDITKAILGKLWDKVPDNICKKLVVEINKKIDETGVL